MHKMPPTLNDFRRASLGAPSNLINFDGGQEPPSKIKFCGMKSSKLPVRSDRLEGVRPIEKSNEQNVDEGGKRKRQVGSPEITPETKKPNKTVVTADIHVEASNIQAPIPLPSIKAKNETVVNDQDLVIMEEDHEPQPDPNKTPNSTQEVTPENLNVFVKGINAKLTKANPIKIGKDLTEQFGPIKSLKMSEESYRITCSSMTQKRNILKSNFIVSDIRVTPSEPQVGFKTSNRPDSKRNTKVNKPRFERIIHGVPSGVEPDELKEFSGAYHVIRITKKQQDGSWHDRMSVVLFFENEDNIPERVFIGEYMSFPVRVYKPEPVQCSRCFKYGHLSNKCRSPASKCCICSKVHDATTRCAPYCINCKGEHFATDKRCPRYLEIKTVRCAMAVTGKSYRDAAKTALSSTPAPPPPPAVQAAPPTRNQVPSRAPSAPAPRPVPQATINERPIVGRQDQVSEVPSEPKNSLLTQINEIHDVGLKGLLEAILNIIVKLVLNSNVLQAKDTLTDVYSIFAEKFQPPRSEN